MYHQVHTITSVNLYDLSKGLVALTLASVRAMIYLLLLVQTIIESRDTNTYTNSRYLMWVDLSILGKTEKWGKAL